MPLQLLKAEINQRPPPEVPRTYPINNTMMTRAIGYYEDASSLYISQLNNELFLYKDGTKYRLRDN